MNPPVCKSIKSTCCVAQDFTVVSSNYNGPLEGASEKELSAVLNSRISYLDTILTSFYSNGNALRKRAVEISQGKTLEQACKLSSAALTNWVLPPDLVANTKTAATKCWTFYNVYHQGAICGMCNNDFATAYSYTDKKIFFNDALINKFVEACGQYVRIMAEQVYPWLEDIETLSRCNISGSIPADTFEIQKPFNQSQRQNAVSCVTSGGQSSNCQQLSSEGIKMGIESPWFHGDVAYISTVWYRFQQSVMMQTSYPSDLMSIINYTVDYNKFKAGKGPQPTQDKTKNSYKFGEIYAMYDNQKGKQFDTISPDSSLTGMTTTLTLQVNFSGILNFGGLICFLLVLIYDN